jgi:23S rRNA (cytidine1920-2'-O)/16S rRNA (cytidine1409-2'-O)-methyltransferase
MSSGKPGKVRADQLLVDRGLVENRTRAKALILAGQVLARGVRIDKAGDLLDPGVELVLKTGETSYASRGGFKLEGAIEDLNLDVSGLKALDVGASTGGFTDCLLQKGAAAVTAVDVGYGLLDWRLRNDPRVTTVERTNARNLTAEMVGQNFDLAVIDVSFISLTIVLPAVAPLIRPGGRILAMVKPQFEVGREKVGKGGVVRDPDLQAEAVEKVKKAAEDIGLHPAGTAPSRVKGPKGNQEHFLLLEKVV